MKPSQIFSVVYVRVASILTTVYTHCIHALSVMRMFLIIAVETASNQVHPGLHGPLALPGLNHVFPVQQNQTKSDD